MRWLGWILAGTMAGGVAEAQLSRRGDDAGQTETSTPRRTRLILKDGSYQWVVRYHVRGNVVEYVSAERGGEVEEIPLRLVDLDATTKWADAHKPGNPDEAAVQQGPAAIDPELLKEERDRATLTPEVAKNLRLDATDAVLALDTFRGEPELVPLQQGESDVNRQTSHNVLRQALNPRAVAHQMVVLKGESADVQLHVNQPELFVRVGDATPDTGGGLTVDTHGASSVDRPKTNAGPSEYVVVRVDVRQGARVVASFDTNALGSTTRQQDVVETTATLLPGGHWLKIVPKETLLVGEYALVEVLGENAVNLSVWDFGVHPTAQENRDALLPEVPRTGGMERRGRPQP